MFDFSAEKTAAGVDNTLRLLGLEYVDLIQVRTRVLVHFYGINSGITHHLFCQRQENEDAVVIRR